MRSSSRADAASRSAASSAASGGLDLAPLTPEERGLLALLKMRDEGNAFVGQWEITAAGAARRVPSRLITLGGPELLFGGLTALEREVVREREIDWQTYGLAAVDVAAIGAGVALLRFAGTAARGASTARAAGSTATLGSGALAAAKVLGINAVRFGVPAGLIALLALHPDVFTHYLWIVAESLGMPGIFGPIIGWGIVLCRSRSCCPGCCCRPACCADRLAARRRGARLPAPGRPPRGRGRSLTRSPAELPGVPDLSGRARWSCTPAARRAPWPAATGARRPPHSFGTGRPQSKGRAHAPIDA